MIYYCRTNVTETRFVGSFEFISDEKYTKIGVADGQAYGKDSLCTFTIYGNKYKGRNNKTGEMFSPTYPGERLSLFMVHLTLDIKICTALLRITRAVYLYHQKLNFSLSAT